VLRCLDVGSGRGLDTLQGLSFVNQSGNACSCALSLALLLLQSLAQGVAFGNGDGSL
jgi:hypothetical protein